MATLGSARQDQKQGINPSPFKVPNRLLLSKNGHFNLPAQKTASCWYFAVWDSRSRG